MQQFTMKLEGWSVVALVRGGDILVEEVQHSCGKTLSVEDPIHVLVDHIC